MSTKNYFEEASEAAEGIVKYKMGAKDSDKGQIDCSGWVTESFTGMFTAANRQAGEELFDKAAFKAVGHGSSQDMLTAPRDTHHIPAEENLHAIRETARAGTIIFLDTGKHGWDNSRKDGIDHVVLVQQNSKTGKLEISESHGGKNGGVDVTDFDSWMNTQEKKQRHLFAVDGLALAKPGAEEKLAAVTGKEAPKIPVTETPTETAANSVTPPDTAATEAPKPNALEALFSTVVGAIISGLMAKQPACDPLAGVSVTHVTDMPDKAPLTPLTSQTNETKLSLEEGSKPFSKEPAARQI